MRQGVDFSSYGGPLSQSTIACWKAQGVDHAVVQYSHMMSAHLDALHFAGGIEVEAYVYLYWGVSPWNQTPQDRTRAALQIAGNRISRLWLDAEDRTHPFNSAQLAECVAICEQAGMPTGIYTAQWVWVGYYGNPRGFERLPLWNARGLGHPPQDFNGFVGSEAYGGWTKDDIAIWQWRLDTTLCGHSVDRNVIASTPTPTPELPTVEQASHAIGFLYPAYWNKDRDLLHSNDQRIIRQVMGWLEGGN